MGTKEHNYVLGFFIDQFDDESWTLLVKKKSPSWQEGMLNGIGGKISEGETPRDAMVREAHEEVGLVSILPWAERIVIEGPNYVVHVFVSFQSFDRPFPGGVEPVGVDIARLPDDMLADLRWMLPMLIDPYLTFPIHLKTGPKP